jgi:predicted nuclease of restriction endonuclease-like RecB superfamily
MINPDGKYHGNWRCNMGGVDTNRDWATFNQKEIVLSRDFIIKTNNVTKIEVFIDFHSVFKSCFYVECIGFLGIVHWAVWVLLKIPDHLLGFGLGHLVAP